MAGGRQNIERASAPYHRFVPCLHHSRFGITVFDTCQQCAEEISEKLLKTLRRIMRGS